MERHGLGNYTYPTAYLVWGLNCFLNERRKSNEIFKWRRYAIQNLDGDTMGIYLGLFDDVINYYRKNPDPFAGGRKAASCNFPNQIALMKKVSTYLKEMQKTYKADLFSNL